MGLLTYEGVLGGERYLNQPLNRCARLMAAAHGEQALLSGAAAARVAALRPAEIAGLLDERFRLLTRGRADAAARQQTLQATVEWSYALPGEAERRVFDCLGVFPGSFDAEEWIDGHDQAWWPRQLRSHRADCYGPNVRRSWRRWPGSSR
jgi:predicted ATPase